MMKRKTTVWLIVAAALTLIGGIVFVGGMTVMHWNFAGLSTVRYETNVYDIEDAYTSVSVLDNTTDVVILPGEDGRTVVECFEAAGLLHTVSVEDGVLTVKQEDTRKWYEHIEIGFSSPRITIFLPRGEYDALSVKISTGDVDVKDGFVFDRVDVTASTGDVACRADVTGALNLKTTTGNVCVEEIRAGEVALSTTTGDVRLGSASCGALSVHVTTGKVNAVGVACTSLVSTGDTGKITLDRVTVAGTASVKRGTGDVLLKGCDAAQLVIETTTGSVKGTLLSEKIFLTRTSTGSIDVPRTSTGGRCEVTTSTGDIRLAIGD